MKALVKKIALSAGLALVPLGVSAQQPPTPQLGKKQLEKKELKKVERAEPPKHIAPPVTRPPPVVKEPMLVLKVVDGEVFLGQSVGPEVIKMLKPLGRVVDKEEHASHGDVFQGRYIRVLAARHGVSDEAMKRFVKSVGKEVPVRIRQDGPHKETFLGFDG